MVRAGVFSIFASNFDKPGSDSIWLISCGCDVWYVSLYTFPMLDSRESSVFTYSVISNHTALMSATIFLSYSSFGTIRIESSVYSIYMLYPCYNLHSSILFCLNPSAQLVNFTTRNLFYIMPA